MTIHAPISSPRARFLLPGRALLLALPGLLLGCNSGSPPEEAAGPAPRAQVKVVRPVTEALEEFVSFPATSTYPRKSAVTAPIAAYVTGVRVRIGDRVRAGQVLFTLETRERRALGGSINRIDPSLRDFGLQTVKAPASGVVSLLDQPQPGAFVPEGAPLCTVAESSQLVFQLSLPYEYHQLAAGQPTVTILLPDSTRLTGTVQAPLASVSTGQAEVYLVRPQNVPGVIPENLVVQVRLTKTRHAAAQLLPASAVLSDETLDNYWVMKLVNDSTAIKVPVKLGTQTPEQMQILSPVFGPQDRILRAGNYGLADTAQVKVVR